MAAPLPLSSLTKEQIAMIKECLTITPTKSFSGPSDHYTGGGSDPILFYRIDKKNDAIYLPFRFGYRLAGVDPSTVSRPDLPVKNVSFTGKLYAYQEPIVQEALDQINEHCTTLYAVPPGTGKTMMAAYVSTLTLTSTLVVYPKLTLEPQWESTFVDNTDARVAIVGRDKDISFEKYDVILTMNTRIFQLPPEVLRAVGTLILDEQHLLCAPKKSETLIATTPRYVIAATATPHRDDGLFAMSDAMIGTHKVVRVHTKPFKMIRVLTGYKPPVSKNAQGKVDWSKLVKSITTSEQTNRAIFDLIDMHPEDKIMVLSYSVDHCKFLHEFLKQRGTKVARMLGNDRNYSDSHVLVGTCGKIGTGFDEKAQCPDYGGQRINVLIMAFSAKSKNLLEQTVGRGFRADYPTIYFLQADNPTIKKHWGVLRGWADNLNVEFGELRIGGPGSLGGLRGPAVPDENDTRAVAQLQLARFRARQEKTKEIKESG